MRFEDSSKTLLFWVCSSADNDLVTRACFLIARTTATMARITTTIRTVLTIEMIFGLIPGHFKVNFQTCRNSFNIFCYNARSLTAA
jgi:hypothetical protein